MQTTSGETINTSRNDLASVTDRKDRSMVGVRSQAKLILALGLFGYGLDQGTKYLAEQSLDPLNPPSFLGGFLKLRLIYNPGAAFSLGSSATIVLSLVAIAALVGVVFFFAPRAQGTLQSVIVGFLIAGIAGNLTDRLFRAPGPFRGHVVDFLALPHFAIFNVSDIFITSAAGLIVIASFFRRDSDAKETDSDAKKTDTSV